MHGSVKCVNVILFWVIFVRRDMETKNLKRIVQEKCNDYSHLEDTYRLATGGELVRDPFNSIWYCPEDITLSASVVIPAWNAGITIQRCLTAIEQSSFNRRYPHLLEVIVVDDGSTDDTWNILEHLDLDLRVVAVRQEHYSRSHAMNTGISVAQGDVVVSCDADMILTIFSIEELIKRHQVLNSVLLIGFRCDIDAADPRICLSTLPKSLPAMLPKFYEDNRVFYHWEGFPYPGWPRNMCRESHHLKNLGHGKQLWMADGNTWNLPRMVYGALFSMRRDDWLTIQGFDEQFYGWGWEDTLVGARALALGNYIIPVYAATGLHIAHPIRNSKQWEEAAINSRVYQRMLHTPFILHDNQYLEKAQNRVVQKLQFSHTDSKKEVPPSSFAAFKTKLATPHLLGEYLWHLGRYNEAIEAFSNVRKDSGFGQAWAVYRKGKALRFIRRNVEAISVLTEAANFLPKSALPLVELALAQAASGDFYAAYNSLTQARQREPKNKLLSYILNCPSYKHFKRGQKYASQGYHLLALCDFEAALIQKPGNARVYQVWKNSLREL